MTDIFLGRQPIFNRTMDVCAYELLYRSGQNNAADFKDADQATVRVILNTLVEMGLDNIVNNGKAFINFSKNFLVGKYPILLPANRVVIEILEDVKVDSELMGALIDLQQAGFSFALDDVTNIERVYEFRTLSSIIKLDLMQINRLELPNLISAIKQQGFKVLAEKVETQAEYNQCRRLGVDYYQGFFLCKPNIIVGKKMDSSRLVIMRALAILQNRAASFKDLENLIAQDVGLSYKLLKMTNSGYYSLATEVKSLRQAISLLGFDTLRGWMSLLMMTTLQDKPPELTNIALQRAHMAESLAKLYGQSQPESFFLVGLFSVLDALMDQPMTEIVSQLNLSQNISGALLKHEGLEGFILNTIQNYERGDWNNLTNSNLTPDTLTQTYLESIKWTNILSKEIHTAAMAN